LEPQENNCFNASIDTPAGYAYFGTEYPGRIVKVALGSGNESPLRVGSVLLDETENVRVGVVDSTTGVGCFSVRNRLFKIRLGRADEPPAIVNRLELPGSPDTLVSAVVDPSTHTAYFGSEGAEVYKIALGEDDSPLRFVAGLQLQKGEGGLRGALIDFQNGFAWFTSNRGSVVKIALGEKDDPPTRLGALKLESRLRYLEHTFGMDQAGYAYYGTVSSGNSEGAVLKVTLGKKGDLPRLVSLLRLNPGEDYISQGVVDPIGRTLCLGIGTPDCSLLKLSLGEGDGAPRIIGAVKLYSR
jgi:hypothetical protein